MKQSSVAWVKKMNEERLTFNQFKEDMKIMYEVKGRYLVKEFSKMQLIITFFLILMKKPLEFDWLFIGIIGLLPGFLLILSYLIVYFSEYRKLFQLWRQEAQMEMKYPFMYEKFMKKE